MARDLTSAMQSALAARTVYPAALLQLDFDSGTTRVWTGYGPLSWNGETWAGAGEILKITPARETTEVRANAANVELSGIPSAYISLALQEEYQGRDATMYLALMDEEGNVLSDPTPMFKGRMDQMQISEDGSESIITLGLESHLIDLKSPREFRYTNQDQQIHYPGDRGFEYIAGLQDKRLTWGPDNRSDEQKVKDLKNRRGDVSTEIRTRETSSWIYRERVAVTDDGEVLATDQISRTRPEGYEGSPGQAGRGPTGGSRLSGHAGATGARTRTGGRGGGSNPSGGSARGGSTA